MAEPCPERDKVPPLLLKALKRSGPVGKVGRKNIEQFVKQYADEGKILYLGSNRATHAAYIPNRVGLDVRGMPGMDIVGDAHELHLISDETFYRILSTEVLELLHTPEKALDESHLVQKKVEHSMLPRVSSIRYKVSKTITGLRAVAWSTCFASLRKSSRKQKLIRLAPLLSYFEESDFSAKRCI